MPVLMSTYEMTELANRLAKMRFNRAKAFVRTLDKERRLDFFRNSIGAGKYHTRYTLPNKGLWITLIENQLQDTQPDRRGTLRTRFRYVEARVEPIPEKIREQMLEAIDEAGDLA